jgi:preprotein translocase subunit SecG
MTILADTAGWNSIITNVLLVVHVVVCILLCFVVLMQRPKQEGLGAAFGGGMTDQAFGARTTDVLQKGTVILASLLFAVTLVLSILVGTKSRNASITDELASDGETAVEANAPAALDLMKQLELSEGGDGELSADAIAAAMKEATGDTEVNEAAPESTPDPVTPTPPTDPVTPVEPTNSGQ